MPIRLAIVGPGRLGGALSRRAVLADDGVFEFLGAFGPKDDPAALSTAACVLVAVPDPVIAAAVRDLAARGFVRRCSLWLHCAGGRPVGDLGAASAEGARTGVFHPLAPVPSAEDGERTLDGAPVAIEVESGSVRLVEQVAKGLGLRPTTLSVDDRTAYHAACALAANGTTALLGAAGRLLAEATSLEPVAAERLLAGLAGRASGLVEQQGAGPSLSGPVRRLDDATIRAQLDRIREVDPEALPIYRSAMRAALRLLTDPSPDPIALETLRRLLTDSND